MREVDERPLADLLLLCYKDSAGCGDRWLFRLCFRRAAAACSANGPGGHRRKGSYRRTAGGVEADDEKDSVVSLGDEQQPMAQVLVADGGLDEVEWVGGRQESSRRKAAW